MRQSVCNIKEYNWKDESEGELLEISQTPLKILTLFKWQVTNKI